MKNVFVQLVSLLPAIKLVFAHQVQQSMMMFAINVKYNYVPIVLILISVRFVLITSKLLQVVRTIHLVAALKTLRKI